MKQSTTQCYQAFLVFFPFPAPSPAASSRKHSSFRFLPRLLHSCVNWSCSFLWSSRHFTISELVVRQVLFGSDYSHSRGCFLLLASFDLKKCVVPFSCVSCVFLCRTAESGAVSSLWTYEQKLNLSLSLSLSPSLSHSLSLSLSLTLSPYHSLSLSVSLFLDPVGPWLLPTVTRILSAPLDATCLGLTKTHKRRLWRWCRE